ncbi:MAG: S-layer homology domain-containing protein [Actinomycetota bacterium]|nr:S-layer homology domain-containing protein [Actinomycetota bacterium]
MDRTYIIRIRARWVSHAIVALIAALVAFPVGALASDRFPDVPFDNIFHDDINAIADAGVTIGFPDGTYRPTDFVTREQMAAFMNRLGALGPDKSPVVNADRLDGRDSTSFLGRNEKAADSELLDGFEAVDFVFAASPTINLTGIEDFDLAGGSPAECATTAALGFRFGTYSVAHVLYDTPSGIQPEGVNLAIDETEAGLAADEYEVCFASLGGTNLPAGTYGTYFDFNIFLDQLAASTGSSIESLISGTTEKQLLEVSERTK